MRTAKQQIEALLKNANEYRAWFKFLALHQDDKDYVIDCFNNGYCDLDYVLGNINFLAKYKY